MMRIYPTIGAGLLVISCKEISVENIDRAKLINQYGRHVYNPFQVDNLTCSEASNNLEIISIEVLNNLPKGTNKLIDYGLMDAPQILLKSFFDVDEAKIFSEDNTLSNSIRDASLPHVILSTKKIGAYPEDDDKVKNDISLDQVEFDCLAKLYAIGGYIDKNESACQNKKMLCEAMEKTTYRRWVRYGSLYFITPHSMVFLTGQDSPDYLMTNFYTIYLEMVIMVLAQRVGILFYSNQAGIMVNQG